MPNSLNHFFISEARRRIYTKLIDEVAPEFIWLFPQLVTQISLDGTIPVGMYCTHPKHVPSTAWEPPKVRLYICYRFGERHQWLLASERDPDRRMRRVDTLLRLLLRRLWREVNKARKESING